METPRSLMQELLCFRAGDAKRLWREGIKARDNYRCVYCGSTENLTIDHVRPKCMGGFDHADNCVTACRSCNQAKGSMPVQLFLELYDIHPLSADYISA
jgi:5-methylcytosine-specific restriction endonuclease McrA